MEAMSESMDAELVYKVYETQGGDRTLVNSGSKTVRLLSNEQIIWSLKDVTSGASYNLEPTLANWIEAHDEDGKLDEVRLAANSFHPEGKLRGNADGKATLAPDGTYVGGGRATLAPNGTYVGVAYKGYAGKRLAITLAGVWPRGAAVRNLVTNETVPATVSEHEAKFDLVHGPMELNAFLIR